MPPAGERRSARRFPFAASVTLSVEGRSIGTSQTRDLSSKGMFVRTPEVLTAGRACHVALGPRSGEVDGATIGVEGRVVRIERAGVGVEFTEITMESFVGLHRILSTALIGRSGVGR